MKPAAFDYVRPTTLDDAIDVLTTWPQSVILAGGQSLVPMLNMRLARPSAVVDIGRLPLREIAQIAGGVRVSALVTHLQLERSADINAYLPLLAAAAHLIGHVAIRSRGTIGGSMAHADPAAQELAVAIALDAKVEVTSSMGLRQIAASELVVGRWTTVLEPGDMVTAVEFPLPPSGAGWGIAEFKRRTGDFGLAGACALLWPGGGRLTAFGLTSAAVRIDEAVAAGDPAQVAKRAASMIELANRRDHAWQLAVFEAVVEEAVEEAARRMVT